MNKEKSYDPVAKYLSSIEKSKQTILDFWLVNYLWIDFYSKFQIIKCSWELEAKILSSFVNFISNTWFVCPFN